MADDPWTIRDSEGNRVYFTDEKALKTHPDEIGPEKPTKDAMDLIRAFAKRSSPGCFGRIDRATLARALTIRVMNPEAVDQTNTSLCGIVVMVRVWAYDSPAAFVSFATELYEKGVAIMRGKNATGGRRVEPSLVLRQAAPVPGMNQADWLVSAAVRESLNTVFKNYNPLDDGFSVASFTWPSDVKEQFRALGYEHIRGEITLRKTQGYESLREASDLHRANWRVIMLIHYKLLKDPLAITHVGTPDHYVGLISPITIGISTKGPIVYPFKLWSNAGPHEVSDKGSPLSLDTVINHYFGFYAGKF